LKLLNKTQPCAKTPLPPLRERQGPAAQRWQGEGFQPPASRYSGAVLALILFLLAAAPLPRADGTHILPDRFLREWDPVTILFDQDTGPANGGPEDAPSRLVTLSPTPAGAWTWLGPRTLQFRPAEPWTPLLRITVTTHAATAKLVPLLPMPTEAGPTDTPSGINGLDSVALTFPTPVDESALARLTTIDVTAQPGLPDAGHQDLTATDFTITAQERHNRSDPQTYLFALRQPIPDGRIATLHLKLSDAPGLDDPTFSLPLHSAVPFTVTSAICGGNYERRETDGVLHCVPDPLYPGIRQLLLTFSAPAASFDVVHARDALRFTPPLDNLSVVEIGNGQLGVAGKFAADTIYHLTIAAGALRDTNGRPLAKPFTTQALFEAGTPALAWDAPQGITERFGPQMVPLRGHGYDHADLRIYAIDPLSRDFWPFPRAGLTTTDTTPPPLPGTEPAPYAQLPPIAARDIAARIAALGTPSYSALVDLPIHRGGVDTKFGIDVAAALTRIAGAGQPGTYLMGLRTIDGAHRQWLRVQVTDLSLTTVEEADRVRFEVTSLSTAHPVGGAEIALEGERDGAFETLLRGTTDATGSFTLTAPLPAGRYHQPGALRRIVVTKGADTLVLEPRRGPQRYTQGNWSPAGDAWLAWTTASPAPREERPKTLCHVFTERPIYRPEEPMLVAGMIRRYRAGALNYAEGDGDVIITGPNDQEWRIQAPLDDVGGFHIKFDAKTEATGDYRVAYMPKHEPACGTVHVRKEAYRLPTFEVLLTGPQHAALDAPFDVTALARFFAGGLLSARPITWRVTQSPYVWSPPGRDGFVFSSDSRYAADTEFRSTPVLTRDAKTDDGGSAQLTLDPTLEPTAQPRQYLVEATVTGDDDMQVRGTQTITALPPFVLGLKVPRYIAQPGAIDAAALALDGQGAPVPGLKLTVRLIHRQWNSTLQASDFAQGAAKYDTEILDQTIEERHLTAVTDALPLHFNVTDAGVYIVEVEATDKAGRRQLVREDLFMAGATPVTWSRAPAQTVTITQDKPHYDPGETATLILQSPFQTASALMVVEEPEGKFRYDWIDIKNGFGRYSVPLRSAEGPRLAVHALIMRGRLPGPIDPGAPFDQGKPATVAATTWINITPIEHIVRVTFDAPAEARPAQTIDLTVHLSDTAGRPLAGEATVWLVDQAVMSLAKEQKLDPLPAFIVDRPTRLAARDTRGMAFGVLPLEEDPGGDENGDRGMANISVRKNFTPVPFYAPRVKIGPDGTAHLRVKLPDSLTVFLLRAKAISGPERFGFGTGQLPVRLPVVAQSALPRFVRPGDIFAAAVIARVVEGPGGAGRAAMAVQHLKIDGPADQNFAWNGGRPARIDTLVSVPEPASGTVSARVQFTVQRDSDAAGDALQIDLPIRPDRELQHARTLLETTAAPLTLPAPTEPMRAPSYERRVTLSTDPELVRLLAGLNLLIRDPIGGTEQRLALARAELALLPFTPLLDAAGLRDRLATDVAAALAAVKRATDDDGLVAFWPGTAGSVWFTAEAYEVIIAAARAGLPIDHALADRMATVLTASLRSTYPHLMTECALYERAAALTALADGGKLDTGYADELARQAQFLPTEGVAAVATALSRGKVVDGRLMQEVLEVLWDRVNLLNRAGKPVYAGLRDQPQAPAILPSETASLAGVVRAVAAATPEDPRLPILRAGLLGLADGQGWGTTHATAEALRALAAAWRAPAAPIRATLTLPDRTIDGTLDATHPLLQGATNRQAPVTVQAPPGLAVLAATDFVPQQPGAQAHAVQAGLVVTRNFYRVKAGSPLARIDPDATGAIRLTVGDVIEEVDDLASSTDLTNVALRAPLAAGLEPLNPALATATAEATPSAAPTVPPSYSNYGDDQVLQVWLSFPHGTATLRTRLRATIPGTYTAPAALAEALYNPGIEGNSAGEKFIIAR